MIERNQRGIGFSKLDSLDIRNDNTVFEKQGEWFLQLDNGTTLKVSARMGKTLYLALKLMDTHLKSRGPVISVNKEDRESAERRFQSFDCHTFTSVALGVREDELEKNPNLGLDIIEGIFKSENFVSIETYGEFVQFIRNAAQGNFIGVVAVKDSVGRIAHSFIIFISKDDIYIAEKSGFEGSILFANSKDLITNIISYHGNNMAVLFLNK